MILVVQYSYDAANGAWSNTCYTWEALSDAIYIYNKYILTSGIYVNVYLNEENSKPPYCISTLCPWAYLPTQKFLGPPEDVSNNLKIISAFLANAWQESNNYKSCREINPAGKYNNKDCRNGYGKGWGVLPGQYCSSEGFLNSLGENTMNNAKCDSLGPLTREMIVILEEVQYKLHILEII